MDNKVLAVISGKEITERDLENIIARYPAEQKNYFASEMGKKQLLEQMISFELIYKLGQEQGLDKTEEFEKSVEIAKKDILTQISVNRVLSEVVVNEEDAKKYYEENSEMFKEKESVSAKHILVDNQELAEKIMNEINSGEITFEDAAIKYSSCPSNEQGGNLGTFNRGMMVPEFEDAAFTLEIAKVSEPVQTQFGYHLIKVEERTNASTVEFDKVKDQILARLNQEAQENKFTQVSKNLEKKYGVTRF